MLNATNMKIDMQIHINKQLCDQNLYEWKIK